MISSIAGGDDANILGQGGVNNLRASLILTQI